MKNNRGGGLKMSSNFDYSAFDGLGLAELVRRRQVSPEQLLEAALAAIAEVNPRINAVINVLADQARRQIAQGLPEGPFTGVPFLVKDIVAHLANVPTRLGSRFTEGLCFPYDTELVARFRRAGLVLAGITATPEFGYNGNTEPVLNGSTRNPWDLSRMAGGSSGGSAAAVAAGIVPMAHANDGGGSIRIPAAACGLFGLKPTRHRVPGGPDYGDLLNGWGVEFAVTRTVRDAAALLDAVAGPDIGAPAWAEPPTRPFLAELGQAPGRLKIAWSGRPVAGTPVSPECLAALAATVALCEGLGHELVEDAPVIDAEPFAWATVRIWAANLAAWVDGVGAMLGRQPTPDLLEATVWACCDFGRRITAGELLTALSIGNQASRVVGRFFQRYDVFLTPTLAEPPLPLGVLNANAPGLDAEAWTRHLFTHCPFTGLFNTTGNPAISVPLGQSAGGLPIGMHFAGRFADEATLFRLAGQLEQASPWISRRPPVYFA